MGDKLAEYEVCADVQLNDMIIGTDVNDSNKTKNFTLQSIVDLVNQYLEVQDKNFYFNDVATESEWFLDIGAISNYSIVNVELMCDGEMTASVKIEGTAIPGISEVTVTDAMTAFLDTESTGNFVEEGQSVTITKDSALEYTTKLWVKVVYLKQQTISE
jgi:hypothetical protein